MNSELVERGALAVWYVDADSNEGIPEAFAELETRLETMRGRRFYGAFFPADGGYHACVETVPGETLALPGETLPGGRFLKAILRGEPPELYQRIPAAFEELVRVGDHDPDRPSLEFYRRRDEVVLLLPVRG
jgi:hypothetical protein